MQLNDMLFPYNDNYYQKMYINPILMKLRIAKIYYLWTAFFCLIRSSGVKKDEKVLDFGCGIGNLVWALRKLGFDAMGVDSSKSAKKYCRVPEHCCYIQTDKLPYKDSTFGLVYSNEVLEHIPRSRLDSYIKELYRVSKGAMIHMICVKERGEIVKQDKTHEIIESEKWWENKFKSLSFKVKKGNLFYFFPNIFSGKLKLSGIKSGYFYIYKRKKK
ncbi:MAG TPA: class I SAM-dependent methyltransferase [Patescibacteria group bacterium]|nr:class I SAM-dependent methyltransferase [Patescibacteria group bacterium]